MKIHFSFFFFVFFSIGKSTAHRKFKRLDNNLEKQRTIHIALLCILHVTSGQQQQQQQQPHENSNKEICVTTFFFI
jgi:hypothetical protein